MKTRELMQGNFIMWGDRVQKVDVILAGEFIRCEELSADRTVDEFSPIPVTFDILYSCGFVSYYMNPRLEHFFLNTQTYYPFHLYTDRRGDVLFNENLPIKWLHQLQNLFYLHTGEDLIVKL